MKLEQHNSGQGVGFYGPKWWPRSREKVVGASLVKKVQDDDRSVDGWARQNKTRQDERGQTREKGDNAGQWNEAASERQSRTRVWQQLRKWAKDI